MFQSKSRTSRRTTARTVAVAGAVPVLIMVAAGCKSSGSGGLFASSKPPRIQRVVCIYDATPWLNLDRAGDLDPEGFRFRVFLDSGTGRGEKADGMLHVEMYRLDRVPDASRKTRTLVSDWHYATADLPQIAKPGMLGEGYFPQLRWADKNLAGSEVDVVVSFEAAEGVFVRAPTKRLKIPKYEN